MVVVWTRGKSGLVAAEPDGLGGAAFLPDDHGTGLLVVPTLLAGIKGDYSTANGTRCATAHISS